MLTGGELLYAVAATPLLPLIYAVACRLCKVRAALYVFSAIAAALESFAAVVTFYFLTRDFLAVLSAVSRVVIYLAALLALYSLLSLANVVLLSIFANVFRVRKWVTGKRVFISLLIIAVLYFSASGLCLYLELSRVPDTVDSRVLVYENVNYKFLEFVVGDGRYRVFTVCADNAFIEYVVVWNRYLKLHEGLGRLMHGETDWRDVVRDVFYEEYYLKGSLPPKYESGPGPFALLFQYWSRLGYRGPWWCRSGLVGRIQVYIRGVRGAVANHVLLVVGYAVGSDGRKYLVVDGCGTLECYDDVYVELEKALAAVEEAFVYVPLGVSAEDFLAYIGAGDYGIAPRGLYIVVDRSRFFDFVKACIDHGIPIVLEVDALLWDEVVHGPAIYPALLVSEAVYALVKPLFPEEIRVA